jgi:hypothetical protein
MQQTEVNWASRPSNWVADPCFHPLSAQRPRFETLRPAWRIRYSDQTAASSFLFHWEHSASATTTLCNLHFPSSIGKDTATSHYMGKYCVLKSHQQVAPVARNNHPHTPIAPAVPTVYNPGP